MFSAWITVPFQALALSWFYELFVAFKIHSDNGTNCSFWARYTLFPLGFWIVQANWTNICWIIWKERLTKCMCINIIESFGFILDQELKNKNRTDGQRYHYLPFPQKLAGHKYPEMYIGQSNINQLYTFKFYSLFSDQQNHFILLDVINFSSPLIWTHG